MFRNHRLLAFVIFLVPVISLICACAAPPPFPEEAMAALESHWDTLPSAPGIGHRFVRAWPGAPTEFSTAPKEVWCVEAEMTNDEAPFETGLLTWIVVRQDPDSGWAAMLLMAMSSTWPYEACGEGVPGLE